jgi:putative transposase
MVAERESATVAERLITATCDKQKIAAGQLTIQADRGTAMTAKSVALLLADLGVTRTHSCPHVSDDNPYSEAQFKTPKYHPAFPALRLGPRRAVVPTTAPRLCIGRPRSRATRAIETPRPRRGRAWARPAARSAAGYRTAVGTLP